MIKQIQEREYLESFAGSASSEIKASDFNGIDKAFEDKKKEVDISYDK